MSQESSNWFGAGNIAVGFTHPDFGKGDPWWAGMVPNRDNFYPAAIPTDVVLALLNRVQPVALPFDFTTDDGQRVYDSNRQVILNDATGDVFGVFKSGYKIHSYEEWLYHNVVNLLDDEVSIGSAGLLKRGAVAWVQVEKPNTVAPESGFNYRPWINAVTSLDGSTATEYSEGIQVIVCDNTLSIARKAASKAGKVARRKHTTNSLKNMTEIRETLSILIGIEDDFSVILDELTNTTVSESEWDSFLNFHAPVPEDKGRGQTIAMNTRDKLSTLWSSDYRVTPWHGTALGVVQAVNTYEHHVKTVKGETSRVERLAERRISGDFATTDNLTIENLNKVFAVAGKSGITL